MRLLLIRHGETQSNVEHLLDTAYPGAPLTETGQQQAEALVTALATEPIEAVYASTLTRAQQTAAPLAAARDLPVQVIDGVQEIAAGVEEMKPDWDRYIAILQAWSKGDYQAKLDQGETATEFLARFNNAIASIEATGQECVAVVSHGAAIRVWSTSQAPDLPAELCVPLLNTQWITLVGSIAQGWKIQSWGQWQAATKI